MFTPLTEMAIEMLYNIYNKNDLQHGTAARKLGVVNQFMRTYLQEIKLYDL